MIFLVSGAAAIRYEQASVCELVDRRAIKFSPKILALEPVTNLAINGQGGKDLWSDLMQIDQFLCKDVIASSADRGTVASGKLLQAELAHF